MPSDKPSHRRQDRGPSPPCSEAGGPDIPVLSADDPITALTTLVNDLCVRVPEVRGASLCVSILMCAESAHEKLRVALRGLSVPQSSMTTPTTPPGDAKPEPTHPAPPNQRPSDQLRRLGDHGVTDVIPRPIARIPRDFEWLRGHRFPWPVHVVDGAVDVDTPLTDEARERARRRQQETIASRLGGGPVGSDGVARQPTPSAATEARSAVSRNECDTAAIVGSYDPEKIRCDNNSGQTTPRHGSFRCIHHALQSQYQCSSRSRRL